MPDEQDFTVYIFNVQCDAQNAVLNVSALVHLPLNSGLLQITMDI